MLLGIDVGGTHTDAVVISEKGLLAQAKVPTDHDNLLRSIRHAIRAVMDGIDPAAVARLNLSTTLSTNAIVEGKTEEVGLLVSSGPGVDPEFHRVGGQFHVIDGCIDHRGAEIAPLDPGQLDAAVDACRQAGIRVFAAVTKFSTRNPGHEQQIAGAIMSGDGAGDAADFVTLGHSLSGILNFPRRMATAYFNSAVWRTYNDFAWAVEESLEEFGLSPEVNILKADGGTMPMARSKRMPVESILSGPAASVMGIVALNDIRHDCVILDIGGTTTDIAVFADGSPIIEDRGMTLGSYPTLVQALKVRSIGIGGDSALHVSQVHGVTVGPERKGPSMAVGGAEPTLTDAMNCLGITKVGDIAVSIKGVQGLARLWDMIPEKLCARAVDYAVKAIAKAVDDLVHEINDRPVYTIFELLKDKQVRPRRAFVMGGRGPGVLPAVARRPGHEGPADPAPRRGQRRGRGPDPDHHGRGAVRRHPEAEAVHPQPGDQPGDSLLLYPGGRRARRPPGPAGASARPGRGGGRGSGRDHRVRVLQHGRGHDARRPQHPGQVPDPALGAAAAVGFGRVMKNACAILTRAILALALRASGIGGSPIPLSCGIVSPRH